MKIYIPALTYGGIEPGYMLGREELLLRLPEHGHEVHVGAPIPQESLITRGRNRVAHAFLKTSCEAVLLVDCDILFRVDDALRLIDSGLPFVGAPYPAKAPGGLLIGNPLAVQEEGKPAGYMLRSDGFVRARDVGTGFLLLRRDVFERIAPHVVKYKCDLIGGDGETHGAYFDCGPEDTSREDSQYLSEDWWFSRLYQACGGECWLDARARLGHVGKFVYRAPSLEEQWAKAQGSETA